MADILADLLADIFADILADILAGILIDIFADLLVDILLAPQGALVVVVFLDIHPSIQSNPAYRFECSQLF